MAGEDRYNRNLLWLARRCGRIRACNVRVGAQFSRPPPEDVRFIARGAHLAALRDKGLTLNSATGAQKVSR
jgi:hypothetical protein